MSADDDAGADPIGTFAAFGEFDAPLRCAEAVGVDSGASLTKLCARDQDGALHFATWPAPSRERVLELLERLTPHRIGITGCGAAALATALQSKATALGPEVTAPVEFEAWARGAAEMLARRGQASEGPYLLVSVGTGTSMLRVEGTRVERVGGTALGGGTTLGLGRALLGIATPDALEALAGGGERQRVDLMISDLFEDPAAAPSAVVASAFGKLGRTNAPQTGAVTEPKPREEDLAAAVLGLVGDNIGLLAHAHAQATGVARIVYGGSTLQSHPRIAQTLELFGLALGHETIVLPRGGHAGALGALLIGADTQSVGPTP